MCLLAWNRAYYGHHIGRPTKVPIGSRRNNSILVGHARLGVAVQVLKVFDRAEAVPVGDFEKREAREGGARLGTDGTLDRKAAQILHARAIRVRHRPAPRQLNALGLVFCAQVGNRLGYDVLRRLWRRLTPTPE